MADTASARHPHEPEIPPTLDNEGRCLICQMMHVFNQQSIANRMELASKDRIAALEAEKAAAVAAEREACARLCDGSANLLPQDMRREKDALSLTASAIRARASEKKGAK